MRKREDKSLIMIVAYFAFSIGLFSLFLGNLNTAHAVTDNKRSAAVTDNKRSALFSQDSPYTFEQTIKIIKFVVDPLFRDGYEDFFERDFEGALSKFQEMLDKNPGDGDLYFIIGMIYYELDKIEEAINALNNALEYGGVMLNDFGPEFYGHFAMLHLLNEEYLKAVDLSKKAISLDLKNPYSYYVAGLAFNQLDEEEMAITNFEKSIELKPDFYRAYNNLGVSYDDLEQIDRAKESYEKAIELAEEADADYYKAHMNLAGIYRLMGRDDQDGQDDHYEKALLLCKKAIEMGVGGPDAYYNLGNHYGDLGEYQLAIEAYGKALKLEPNHYRTLSALGFEYREMGDYEKAIELHKKAIEINPKGEWARYCLSRDYSQSGQYEQEIVILNDILGDYPNNVRSRYSLAMAYCNLDMADEALEEFYKIIAIDPNHINTNHSLSILNAELGNREEAIFYRGKAIELGADFDKEDLEMIDNSK